MRAFDQQNGLQPRGNDKVRLTWESNDPGAALACCGFFPHARSPRNHALSMATMDRPSQLFADDLVAGLRFHGEAKTLTTEMFLQFAALTGDAHPIHYSEAYAAKTRFGGPLAHGLLLTSLTALGATSFSRSVEDSMVAMLEQRMQFPRPAFIGDVVTPEFEVVSVAPTASGRTARVEMAVWLTNQDGERVIEGRHAYLLRCRSPDA
jgi:3-hydroxybutyryl-CoA dehydratase